jgi:hypothetical protein
MLMVAGYRCFNLITIQEPFRPARVLGGNELYFTQDTEGTQGDIFQITDGSSYNIRADIILYLPPI